MWMLLFASISYSSVFVAITITVTVNFATAIWDIARFATHEIYFHL